MTVEANTVRFSYTGDGVSTVFPFPSRFLDGKDLIVSVDGTVISSGYSVTGAGTNSGGNVVFGSPPGVGQKLVVVRSPVISQLTSFSGANATLGSTIETVADRAAMIDQATRQLIVDEAVNRIDGDLLVQNSIIDIIATQSGPFLQTGVGSITRTVVEKLLDGAVSLEDFRQPGDTTWDAALTRACTALGDKGGVIQLRKSAGDYTFTNPTLKRSCVLVGNYRQPPFPGSNQSVNLNALQYIRIANPAAGSFRMEAGSGIVGVCIAPGGMTFPQPNSSSWVGQALSILGDAAFVKDVLILGFNKIVTLTTVSRSTFERVFADCVNGFDITNSYDTTRMRDIHLWPFATIQAYAASTGPGVSGYDSTINRRYGGTGLKIRGSADDLQIDGMIAIGFDIGFDFEGTSTIICSRLWVESYYEPNTTGFRFGPNTNNIKIASVQLWGVANPIVIDAGLGNRVDLGDVYIVGPGPTGGALGAYFTTGFNSAVSVQSGNLKWNEMAIRGVPDGKAVFSVSSVSSYLEGAVNDENNGAAGTGNSPVVLPVGGVERRYIRGMTVRSPYRTAGTPAFGSGAVKSATIQPVGGFLYLLSDETHFRVISTGAFSIIGGGHGGRQIKLLMVSAGSAIQIGGQILADVNADLVSSGNSQAWLEYNGDNDKWYVTKWRQ